MVFNPRQRSQIYAEMSANVLALAPVTSSSLGEVVDNFLFAVSDQIFELYVEMENALGLLSLDTTIGADLDEAGSEFPDLEGRFAAERATGNVTVTDPNITKVADFVAGGGSNNGDNFLNLVDATSFPSAGSVLVGLRGSSVFETFDYTSKVGNQLQSLTDNILFDHGAGEDVVLSTVGDRSFPGPFTVSTQATATESAKTYQTTSPIVIYDGEESGIVDIKADALGSIGNTASASIVKFIGSKPFLDAEVLNNVKISNGIDRESDADYRARIRRERQSLSSANIDAIVRSLLGTSFEGQRIRFVQLFEDNDPTLPSILYVDDGSGFTPTQESLAAPVTLIASANGGEVKARIPLQYLPIVVSPGENVAMVYANVEIRKNAVVMSQGTGLSQCRVQPDNGLVKFNSPLTAGDTITLEQATYYTGLIHEANNNLYGDRFDRETYRGVVGLGSWVQLRVPPIQNVSVAGNFILDTTRPLSEIVTEVKQAILDYINNLGIGVSIIKNRIVALGFVRGVKDFQLTTPAADIVIPDGILPKTSLANITLS